MDKDEDEIMGSGAFLFFRLCPKNRGTTIRGLIALFLSKLGI